MFTLQFMQTETRDFSSYLSTGYISLDPWWWYVSLLCCMYITECLRYKPNYSLQCFCILLGICGIEYDVLYMIIWRQLFVHLLCWSMVEFSLSCKFYQDGFVAVDSDFHSLIPSCNSVFFWLCYKRFLRLFWQSSAYFAEFARLVRSHMNWSTTTLHKSRKSHSD